MNFVIFFLASGKEKIANLIFLGARLPHSGIKSCISTKKNTQKITKTRKAANGKIDLLRKRKLMYFQSD